MGAGTGRAAWMTRRQVLEARTKRGDAWVLDRAVRVLRRRKVAVPAGTRAAFLRLLTDEADKLRAEADDLEAT